MIKRAFDITDQSCRSSRLEHLTVNHASATDFVEPPQEPWQGKNPILHRPRSDKSVALLATVLFHALSLSFSMVAMAQSANNTLTIQWDASPSSGVGGYLVSWGTTSGEYTNSEDAGPQTSFTVNNLLDGYTYHFAVRAYDAARSSFSAYSNEINRTVSSLPDDPGNDVVTASFSGIPRSGDAPLVVTFTDTSSGEIMASEWSFGDGNTTSGSKVVHTYEKGGTYDVELTTIGSNSSDTLQKKAYITVNAPELKADFTALPMNGEAPLRVSFIDKSSDEIESWTWDFGDGGESTERNPTHVYQGPGDYTVKLSAQSAGNVRSVEKENLISVLPKQVGDGEQVPTDLVAAYGFEGTEGDVIKDASSNKNNGIAYGANRTTEGRFGNALSFDGIDDWVSVADSASLDLTEGMTLQAWIYPTEYMAGWKSILLKEQQSQLVYSLNASSHRKVPATAVYTNREHSLYARRRVRPNRWTHIAATYDGKRHRLYLNGVRVASKRRRGSLPKAGGDLYIGGNSLSGAFFKGRIDEIRIYSRALSREEIRTDMNRPVMNITP